MSGVAERECRTYRAGLFSRSAYAGGDPVAVPAADSLPGGLLRCQLAAMARTRAPRVISVDIFDTLLLRNYKCEARRYWELATLLAQLVQLRQARPATVEDLFVARYLAMRAGYACAPGVLGCREGRIVDVVSSQLGLLGLRQTLLADFIDAEIDYEAANLVPNRMIPATLSAMFPGIPVIGLSDMYLGAEHMAPLITRLFGGAGPLDRVYSSADLVLNKRSGQVYGHIARLMDCSPADLLHIGDNPLADLVQARRSGCAALLYPVPRAALQRRAEDLERFIAERAGDGLDCADYATL